MIERFAHRTAWDLKNDERALAKALEEAGATVKGRIVRCPFCDDHRPSGGIYDANGDGCRYKCHRCNFNGSVLDVIAKADNLGVGEVFRRLRRDSRRQGRQAPKVYPNVAELVAAVPGEFESIHKYTLTTGAVEMIVIRSRTVEGKTFRVARPAADGFVFQAPAQPWRLYDCVGIQNSDTVVVVEGEKCADLLRGYGVAATTSPGGAGKAKLADWTPLTGRNVILWPDNDELGRAHMKDVDAILRSLEPARRISIIKPNDLDLGDKEDAADFIEQLQVLHNDGTKIRAAILEALSRAKPRGVAAGVGELIEDTIAGRRQAIKWPWPCVGGLTKALLPGTVTILCGNVGASKSFMLLQAAAYWHQYEVKTAIYELEEDQAFHLSRCLAQQSGVSDVTDPDWVRQNPTEARRLYSENEVWLDNFGPCIYASPDTQPTFDQLAAWVEDRAKVGCRIIGIDPITAGLHVRRQSWEEDGSFLCRIKRAAVDYRCSIVLVTHPVKTVSRPDLTQLAGGAAYARFAQSIVWLESHGERSSTVKTVCGTTVVKHNRTLHLLKARNGKGQGVKLAFNFEAESLTLKELGIIVRSPKTGKKGGKKTSKKQETEEKAAGGTETQESNGSAVRYTTEIVKNEW